MWSTLQVLIVSAVIVACLYSLQAVGFVLVIRATGVLNFAQGQMLALGAFLFFAVYQEVASNFAVAFAGMFVLSALFAVILYSTILRRLEGAPLWTIVMVLFGVASVIEAVLQIVWGGEFRYLPAPVNSDPVDLPAGFVTNTLDLTIILISAAAIALLLMLIYLTPLGLRMRAAAENKLLATYAGVGVERVATASWVLASAFVSLAGLWVAFRTTLHPAIGIAFLTAFPAVILGGYESLAGAVVGGILLAFIVQAGITYGDSSIAVPLSYAILFLVLMVRPWGLFGARETLRV